MQKQIQQIEIGQAGKFAGKGRQCVEHGRRVQPTDKKAEPPEQRGWLFQKFAPERLFKCPTGHLVGESKTKIVT